MLKAGVVDAAPHSSELLPKAIEIATEIKSKGRDAKTRETLHGIKKKLYKDAVALLGCDVEDMGFATGTFDATGRAAKLMLSPIRDSPQRLMFRRANLETLLHVTTWFENDNTEYEILLVCRMKTNCRL